MTFTYRRVGSNRLRKMTLDAMEFLRRFLQHVLPAGFQKVRHYGFLSPGAATSIEVVRWLVDGAAGLTYVLLAERTEEPAARAGAGLPGVRRSAGAAGIRAGPVPAIFDTS